MNLTYNTKNVHKNSFGGLYQQGKMYDICTKIRIVEEYIEEWDRVYPERPTITDVAKNAKVSWSFVKKCVSEASNEGLVDPEAKTKRFKQKLLTDEEEIFLLSLRADIPNRPNQSYIKHLFEFSGRIVSSSFISKWFKTRFQYSGAFKKPCLVPFDKFRRENFLRYVEFCLHVKAFDDHTRFNFLDEKKLKNSDIYPKKIRPDPVTGNRASIPVTGSFRNTYNMFAAITADPNKAKHAVYEIDASNGNSESFMAFIVKLVGSGWLKRGDVLILDNCSIHNGSESSILEKFLWECKLEDDLPLQVLVLFLPARAPELNPIELVFHIVDIRIRDAKYKETNFLSDPSTSVAHRAAHVLDTISYDTIRKCCQHCGYLVN